MDYRKAFIVGPGREVRLAKVDPSYTGKHPSHRRAPKVIEQDVARKDRLQSLLRAGGKDDDLIKRNRQPGRVR